MIGETLGSYRIVGRLGAGGMGEVYQAEHTRIDRRVAIKVLLPELSHNQEVVDRFFAEARSTASIRHPGIVQVMDCDVHASGRAYIVMELLEGESLQARLSREPGFGRNVERTLSLSSEVADAIAAAHAKGIVHRDLKPDNVFLTNAPRAPNGFVVKILDFGIAKLIGDGDGNRGGSMRTRTGSLLGTPAYMSPEQCRGASRVDHRTDIYSFGCIAYELLAGQRPFTYEGFGELISAHMTETPKSMAELGIKVAPAVEEWIERLLAKSPNDRFASMNDVAAAIEALRTGRPTRAARRDQHGGAARAGPAARRTDAVGDPHRGIAGGRARERDDDDAVGERGGAHQAPGTFTTRGALALGGRRGGGAGSGDRRRGAHAVASCGAADRHSGRDAVGETGRCAGAGEAVTAARAGDGHRRRRRRARWIDADARRRALDAAGALARRRSAPRADLPRARPSPADVATRRIAEPPRHAGAGADPRRAAEDTTKAAPALAGERRRRAPAPRSTDLSEDARKL